MNDATQFFDTVAGGPGGYEIERSLRFNSSDSAYLSRTPSTAGNRKTFTFACWAKLSGLGTSRGLLNAAESGTSNPRTDLRFDANDNLSVDFNPTGGSWISLATSAVFRDTSAWYHVVIAVDTTQATSTNRVKVYVNGAEQVLAGSYVSQNTDLPINNTWAHSIGRYQAGPSSYFNGYLADVHFIDGQALDPTSFGEFDANGVWQPIAYAGSYGTNGFHLPFSDNSTAAALGTDTSGNGNDWTVNNIVANGGTVYSNNVVSSTGAFYSIYTPDKLFDGSTTNPVLPEPNVSTNYCTCTFSPALTGTIELYIQQNSPTTPIEINGTAYFPSGTGWYTSPISTVSSIKAYGDGSATYRRINAVRVNGTILVDGVPANIDSLVDSPTNGSQEDTGAGSEVRGNYCTWNPLIYRYAYTNKAELTNGNLDALFDATVHGQFTYGTISVSTGKWYFEYLINNTGGGGAGVGVANYDHANNLYSLARYYQYSGNKSDGTSTSYGASYTSGSVIGVALDMDTGSLTFYKNGVSQGVAFTDLLTLGSVSIFGSGDNSSNFTINAGQRPFAYTAPSGFKALCTTNLPEPTIADGSTAMDVALYTGNGSTQTISGLNFGTEPGLLWIKSRNYSGAGYDNILCDNVRGSLHYLESNRTDAEYVSTAGNDVSGFVTDGFTLGPVYNFNGINGNLTSNVAWTWNAGSSTVTNNDGSISSQVRANASAGFSVVTYTVGSNTSQTIGHGLGVAPQMIIVKERNQVNNWQVYHTSLGNGNFLYLNSTNASAANNLWDNTSPTSTVFSIRSGGSTNFFDGKNHVAYCFAPVAGYSAFGSYTGNGSADGTFVYTGFRPAFVMLKASSATGGWAIEDYKINNYNATGFFLVANANASQSTGGFIDFLSNGFKLRLTSSGFNGNGVTYIYAAFAEHPFATSRAR
jgi:hypothetical protein